MLWEDYKHERFRLICEGKGCPPGRKEVLKKIMRDKNVWHVDDILPIFCQKTGIDVESARKNIPIALENLVLMDKVVKVSDGYYRLK